MKVHIIEKQYVILLAKQTVKEIISIQIYPEMKEFAKILGEKYTIDILFYLNHEPMRYKEIKAAFRCSDNTLSRRIKKLKQFKIIEPLSVVIGKKRIEEYTLTERGQKVLKFFRDYNKNNEKGK